MCDDFIHQGLIADSGISRRTFGAAIATGAAMVAMPAAARTADVVERDVDIVTPDGTCDAVQFHPAGKGRWPAVLIWTDIMGLRPAFRDMGHRMAAAGHVVLVPNPFYRSRRAPVVEGPVDLNDPAQRSALNAYRTAMGGEAGAQRDAKAFLAHLDAQPQTDPGRKAGVQGYCMGGALAFYTAAAVLARIAAVASFHGGTGLVTDQPDSPSLTVAHTRATYLVGQAQNDDQKDPAMKERLRAALEQAGRPATVEVFPADHGWCVPGGHAYDAAQAEKAWGDLLRLYAGTLV